MSGKVSKKSTNKAEEAASELIALPVAQKGSAKGAKKSDDSTKKGAKSDKKSTKKTTKEATKAKPDKPRKRKRDDDDLPSPIAVMEVPKSNLSRSQLHRIAKSVGIVRLSESSYGECEKVYGQSMKWLGHESARRAQILDSKTINDDMVRSVVTYDTPPVAHIHSSRKKRKVARDKADSEKAESDKAKSDISDKAKSDKSDSDEPVQE